MSDRGRGRGASTRGGTSGLRGGPNAGSGARGGGTRLGRGGGRGGSNAASERPKKEAILDLAKYVDKEVRVKFAGGREVVGILKGYDQLMNLVMDDVHEALRDSDSGEMTDKKRSLGLAVLRGTALTVMNPADGFEQIENPFASTE